MRKHVGIVNQTSTSEYTARHPIESGREVRMKSSREQVVHCERELAEAALKDRGNTDIPDVFRKREFYPCDQGQSYDVDYE